MQNPFAIIDNRLTLIEELLLEIKHKAQEVTRKPQLSINDPETLLTKKEAAKLLSCSVSTIDNYARAELLPRHYVGRAVRFRRAEILAITSSSGKK